MSEAIRVYPCNPVRGSIRPPGSKSLTNRALICAALAAGESDLTGVLDSEDTQVMVEAWRSLGVDVQGDIASGRLTVRGCNGELPKRDSGATTIFIGNSGTSIRFLTAALAACHGEFVLDGVPRMRERPILDLLTALNSLGADSRSLNADRPNCPPVSVRGRGLAGGTAAVAGNISSQYLSGLMMAAPMASGPVQIEVVGELVSVPYVEMTARVMESFGAEVTGKPTGPIEIAPTRYRGAAYDIEPDASAASYFWAAAAVTEGDVTVEGLSRTSLQGDVRFVDVLEQMGCTVETSASSIRVIGGPLRGVDVDMSDISDTVQTLAAVALFAEGPTRVRGVAHNRHKETDRIGDLAVELRKLGAEVETFEDGLEIRPQSAMHGALLDTYRDHRMAMSFAVIALRQPDLCIADPACTAKTYPGYWDDLARLTHCRMERVIASVAD
ncbi:MAG: 3-phosphoshikimate 1-carboxyvinyltransferase [Pirellulales bacterium]